MCWTPAFAGVTIQVIEKYKFYTLWTGSHAITPVKPEGVGFLPLPANISG
jgi:hypothetical protein